LELLLLADLPVVEAERAFVPAVLAGPTADEGMAFL
jgi:hypothetical protein